MVANSDLPPAYTTLPGPPPTLNINIVEEPDLKCEESTRQSESGDEAELLVNDSFEDKTVRLIFIQKVLTVKFLQLIAFAAFVGIFFAIFDGSYYYMRYYDGVIHCIVSSIIVYLVIFILLVCCDKARRRNPYKYIFLVAYPLSLAFFITSVAYSLPALTEVAMAWIYHCAAMFAVLIYSIFMLQSKYEFVTLYAIFIGAGVHIVLYALSVPFVWVSPFFVLYPTLILMLEHVYILFTLRVMTTNDYKRPMTPDDYIDAALNLHIDYIYIIINFLVPKIRTAFAKCANK